MDEMHWRLRNDPGKGWFARGFRPTTVLNNTRGRVTVFGAIGVDPAGDPLEAHEFYDRGDMENMLDFMRSLHKKFGRMVVFMDNVSYHGKERLERLSRELDGEIAFRFFPPYTPELSPIEMFWREIRRHTRNTYFASVEKFISAVDSAIRNRVIRPIKMFDYLMPPT